MPATGMREKGLVSVCELACGRIEPEVLVWLSSPVYPGAHLDEVRAAVGAISLGFELVDSHYPGWKATPPDLLADFGCHGGLVAGAQAPAAAVDLDALAAMEVRLVLEGQEQHHGQGADVLGGPLESIVRVQRSACATRLPAGHVIATGSLTGRSHPMEASQRWILEVVNGPELASTTLEVR
jgi:2-oxo-3-hexenedioate decarboxylase